MNLETFLNVFDITIDDEHCASLTPSFCPEIIALLHSQRRNVKWNLPSPMSTELDYGFDEHAYGLA